MLKTTVKLLLENGRAFSRPQVYFSTVAQLEIQEKLQGFRTTETDPRKHTKEHIGQFYTVNDKDKNQLFTYGGLPKTFLIQTKTFNEVCLMVRQPSIDLINYMRAVDYSKPAVRFVMYGQKGIGKSLSLAHVIHYAYKEGYLIVHVPWVGNWMRRCKESSNSESKEGYIDINIDAAAWLVQFKTQNADLLVKPEFKTSQDYIWSKREVTPEGSTISDLVEHGINRIKYATDTIVALSNEIKLLSNNGICKTFVAIDGFNAFFYPYTRIKNEKKEVVHPRKVTITEPFINLTIFDWKNAFIVAIVDEMAIAEKDQISHLPKYLLCREGFEHMDPFIPLLVEGYSKKELTSCMDYYRERRWVKPYPGQDEEVAFLSSSNPYRLMQICDAL